MDYITTRYNDIINITIYCDSTISNQDQYEISAVNLLNMEILYDSCTINNKIV